MSKLEESSLSDIQLYAHITAVRIFIGEPGQWKCYAGIFKDLCVNQDPNYMHLDCYCRIESIVGDIEEPLASDGSSTDLKKPLFNGSFRSVPGSFTDNRQPFKVDSPEKLAVEPVIKGTMVIKFTKGWIVLSTRPNDLKAMNKLLDEAGRKNILELEPVGKAGT